MDCGAGARIPSGHAGIRGIAKRGVRERLGWLVAAVAILVAVVLAAAVFYFRRPSAELKAVHFTVTSPEKQNLPLQLPTARTSLVCLQMAASWHLSRMDATGHSQLWLRDFDSPTAQPLPGRRMHGLPFGRRIAASLLLLQILHSRRSRLPEAPPKPSRLRRPTMGEPGIAMGSSYFRPVPGVDTSRPFSGWFGDSCHFIGRIPAGDLARLAILSTGWKTLSLHNHCFEFAK